MTILVIDDDPSIRGILSEAMVLWGHKVLQGECGQDGLEVFESHTPDIVVTDIMMPDIDGLEVLRKIKAKHPDTEVIVVTGYGDVERVTEALRADASDFVQKPIQMDVLSVALQRAEQRLTMRRQLKQYTEHMARLVDERTAELALERNRLQSMNTQMMALNQTLERKNQELEDFVYTVSHDLKAPIISVQGFSSLLLQRYSKTLEKAGRHYLQRIQENAEHMERLIADLLELSRIGRTTETYEEIDVKEVVDSVLESVRFQLEEKEADVRMPERFPRVRCSRLRLVQVFTNLISNATKYADPKRPLRVEVGWGEDDDRYRFYVRDNGIGIDPAYHERIFGVFQRLQDVKEVEGTGAGLTIARRIIDHHGGQMWVESEHGKGATFYFALPKREAEQA